MINESLFFLLLAQLMSEEWFNKQWEQDLAKLFLSSEEIMPQSSWKMQILSLPSKAPALEQWGPQDKDAHHYEDFIFKKESMTKSLSP